jgi:hypothetical protein
MKASKAYKWIAPIQSTDGHEIAADLGCAVVAVVMIYL